MHPARYPAGPEVGQQHVQLTRILKVRRSTAPSRMGATGPDRPRGDLRDLLLPCDWGQGAVHGHRIPTDRA